MSPDQLAKFAEVRRLLAEGYARYSDCHKSSDGYCEVMYPTAYSDEEGCGGVEANGLMVWSYVFGPSRAHHFYKGRGRGDYCTFYSADPFATALREVQKWMAEYSDREADQ